MATQRSLRLVAHSALGLSFLAATTALLLGGCASPPPGEVDEDQLAKVYRLREGQQLAGRIVADEIWLPAGTRVEVTGDLELIGRLRVDLEGVIEVRDAPSDGRDSVAAPFVRIESGERLSLDGELLGGDGHAQGAGSTIVLMAPEQSVTGRVQGGDGGDALGAGPGGSGGDVWVLGDLPADRLRSTLPRSTSGLFGGSGGYPDGRSGSARALSWEQRDSLPPELRGH